MTTDPKLSDTQRVILSAACARDDRCVFPIPLSVKAKGGALQKVLASLIAKGLIETVPAGMRDAEWARSDDDEPLTLRATTLALNVLGIEPDNAAPGATQGDEPEGATAGPPPSRSPHQTRPLRRVCAGPAQTASRPT